MASALRCSHLNRALVAKAKNAAKAECLGLVFVHFWLGFVFQILVFHDCANQALVFLWSDFLFQKPIHLLRVSSVILSFQMSFLVLLARFLRRFKFQVVSVTGALKLRLILVFNTRKASVGKAAINFKSKL
ncbi:hypothetical protein [Vibrio alginolyticus]|uniref:hypothetical protein n=1 Tax=Vibrio alginolyticus TaxID=663 RepID=UPI0011103BBE|nr:hypothetical protein [Vibrio alginolyticus]TMX48027.1 hypothetical protein DA091_24525 [Vibrio alginolyticus]